MAAGYKGLERNRPVTPLLETFKDALAQPYHIAVKRIKLSFFFTCTAATMEESINDAFENTRHSLSKSSLSKFLSGGGGLSREDTYWSFNQLERYADGKLETVKRKELCAELNVAMRSSTHNYEGTDAKDILEYFNKYANPTATQGSPVLLDTYLQDMGFSNDALAILTAATNAQRVINLIGEQNDPIALRKDLTHFLHEQVLRLSTELGATQAPQAKH